MDYIRLMIIYHYDIMAICESGECADFHLFFCWQNRTCFYDNMLQACFTALEMGWF